MKIIHCADLHLDSPMLTHMTRERAAIRNVEILRSFQRMTEYARQQEVDLVLIAGDFFDGERVTNRTMETVLGAMRKTPNIDYLYVCGNHDQAVRAFADHEMPENLKCFTDEWKTYTYGEVAVSGIEMTPYNADTLYQTIPEQDHQVNIVMLHGQTGSCSGMDCVNLNLLRNKGIHYLALGHIHTYTCERLDTTGIYCYPGCLEGRGFDECGEKGFVVLDTDMPRLDCQFVPFSGRKLHCLSIDITGLQTNSAVYDRIKEETEDISKNDMVKLVLTGSYMPESRIAQKYLYNMLAGDFFFIKIKDETRLFLEPLDYEHDISLKGEFVRLVMTSDLPEHEKTMIIRTGLEALTGEEITI